MFASLTLPSADSQAAAYIACYSPLWFDSVEVGDGARATKS